MINSDKKSGFLITIEGIDGSGKSTVAKKLCEKLEDLKYNCVLTKEPGATALGKYLRSILQTRTFELCPESEFLLFASDRAQHICELVEPALSKGFIVISDRMADSSLAYQGYGRGLDLNIVSTVNAWAMRNIEPDLTIYLKIDYKTAIKRLQERNQEKTTFEKEKEAFFERVINGFETIFARRSNVITIDAKQPIEFVVNSVCDKVLEAIKQHQ